MFQFNLLGLLKWLILVFYTAIALILIHISIFGGEIKYSSKGLIAIIKEIFIK